MQLEMLISPSRCGIFRPRCPAVSECGHDRFDCTSKEELRATMGLWVQYIAYLNIARGWLDFIEMAFPVILGQHLSHTDIRSPQHIAIYM